MTADQRPADDGGELGHATRQSLCRQYDVALLDLDGVVYRGEHAVAGAAEALTAAREAGMQLAFVTNNASRTPAQIVEQLTGLGVEATPDEVVTSAQAASRLVVTHYGEGTRTFVVGGEGLRAAAREVGLELVEAYDVQPPPAVLLQGFSADLRYEDLAQAALVVDAGAAWVATNTDSTLPTSRGIQPGNGTLVAAVAAATGRQPLVAGKPSRGLVDETVRRTDAQRPLMVGDRLDTDIAGAHVAAMDSLLVLTGIATIADLLTAPVEHRPDYLAWDLAGLLRDPAPLTRAGVAETGWSVEQTKHDHVVHLLPPPGQPPEGPPASSDEVMLDGIRTLVVGAWAMHDEGRSPGGVRVARPWRRSLVAAGVPADLMLDEEVS